MEIGFASWEFLATEKILRPISLIDRSINTVGVIG